MDRWKLEQLLRQEEGPKLDFKARLGLGTESEKKELTKDVIAMANSRGGRGYIVFGVEDKSKKLTGIDPQDIREEQIQQIIYNRCDPPVPVDVTFIEHQGVTLAVLTVYRSHHGPHQMMQNGAFYVRRGSTTDTARRAEIANMMQENGLMTYETVMLRHVSATELSEELLESYFANMQVASAGDNYPLLEAMGFVAREDPSDAWHATIGGLMLFGRNPAAALPHMYIKVVHGEDIRLFTGNILALLDSTTAYLKALLPEDSFPFGALEEAVANALAHRDWLDVSRGITITVDAHYVEVGNPGSLLAGNKAYSIQKEHNPERRNGWLYQRLLVQDSRRRFMRSGIGMTRIRKAFSDIGDVKFINLGTKNLFKVILPRENHPDTKKAMT